MPSDRVFGGSEILEYVLSRKMQSGCKRSAAFCTDSLKGGESSSQFQWLTIAKIELHVLIFFCFNFGTAVAKIFNKYKKMSPRKKFLETLSFVLPAKTTESLMVYRTVVGLIV